MTSRSEEPRDIESRLRELRELADEGLITPDEYEQHRRRIAGESGAEASTDDAGSAADAMMHGDALDLLDELIGARWSRWDEQEEFYLNELAPKIVRSSDPDFRWVDNEAERVVLVRLRALMSVEEWTVLPELIRARRAFTLDELESDRGRPERLRAWTEASERARRAGRERIKREEAAAREAAAPAESQPAPDPAPPPDRVTAEAAPESETSTPPADGPNAAEPAPSGTASPASDARGRAAGSRSPGARTGSSRRRRRRTGGAASRRARDAAASPVGGASPDSDGTEAPADASPPVAHEPDRDAVQLEPEAPPAENAEAAPPEGSPASPRRGRWWASEQDASQPEPDDGEANAVTPETDDDEREEQPSTPDDTGPGDRVDEGGPPEPPPTNPAGRDGLPEGSGSEAADGLDGYAQRLGRAGEHGLSRAVADYAGQVRAVERGDLPPGLSLAPAAVTPGMVGAALAQRSTSRRVEGLAEFVRNVLIFVPVLWTWIKLRDAVSAYQPQPDVNFFDFWVRQGGGGVLPGSTLADAAVGVAISLVALIGLNALVGFLRRRAAGKAARIGRDFAAALALAEATGSARRVADPQAALEGFVHASTGLTENLRSVAELLRSSSAPFAESVQAARDALRAMSEATARQERQLDDVIERLGRVSEIGNQLAALHGELAAARDASARAADALEGIRDDLGPSASDLAGAAERLRGIADQLERATGIMAETITNQESGLESVADVLRETAATLNTVATRILDDLNDSGGRGDRR